jgi:Tfp pilus assembly protein PilV
MMRLSSTRSTSALRRQPRGAVRRGMTLIEVMISLTSVTSALLGFGAFIARFMHVTSQADASSVAMDLAVSRVELIKAWPTYSTLETTFNGTQASLTNCPGCVLTTLVTKDSTALTSYKTVTVTVTVPGLSSSYTAAPVAVPFEKTTVIAQF